jgi:hypothetical protein
VSQPPVAAAPPKLQLPSVGPGPPLTETEEQAATREAARPGPVAAPAATPTPAAEATKAAKEEQAPKAASAPPAPGVANPRLGSLESFQAIGGVNLIDGTLNIVCQRLEYDRPTETATELGSLPGQPAKEASMFFTDAKTQRFQKESFHKAKVFLKGNEVVKETYELFKKSGLNFIGNIEGKELIGGAADVAVTDGFTGNVLLKSSEAVAKLLVDKIREAIRSGGPLAMIGGLLVRPALGSIKKMMDPSEAGAAPLLGVNGLVFIGHGRSDAVAIKNAARVAKNAVEANILDSIRTAIEQSLNKGNES